MAIPNIDTFEQDIREEIRHKEASVTNIASAGGNVGNNPVPVNSFSNPNSSKRFLVFGGIIFIVIFGSFSYLGYLYLNQQPITQKDATQLVDAQTKSENTPELISQKLNNFSPILSENISRFTTKVDANTYGTVITTNDYASTFAFMIKNESEIAKEVLAGELKNYENSTTTPDLTFTDVTKSNQNMRELTVGSSTLVYAFINDQYLVFSSSADNILKIRGAIIK